MARTSIIIRTKNEAQKLPQVMEMLAQQTDRDFEVLVVDSGSTDATLEIARVHGARIVHIAPESFTYPHAINVGCRAARATTYFLILSGHSIPISATWLADGIAHFTHQSIAGVYGNVWAHQDAGIWEKFLFNEYRGRRQIARGRVRHVHRAGMGVLGFTNALIRRDLWEQYPIDEAYAGGGEDRAWARHWIERGYTIVCDARFSVYHSHGLGLWGLVQQYRHWCEVVQPRPYARLAYRHRRRSDGTH